MKQFGNKKRYVSFGRMLDDAKTPYFSFGVYGISGCIAKGHGFLHFNAGCDTVGIAIR